MGIRYFRKLFNTFVILINLNLYFPVILVGDAAVGKSVLMSRLMGNAAPEGPQPTPTVSADFGVTAVVLDGVKYRVQVLLLSFSSSCNCFSCL